MEKLAPSNPLSSISCAHCKGREPTLARDKIPAIGAVRDHSIGDHSYHKADLILNANRKLSVLVKAVLFSYSPLLVSWLCLLSLPAVALVPCANASKAQQRHMGLHEYTLGSDMV